jgi:tetratricopeptide (TPR) repeat protein
VLCAATALGGCGRQSGSGATGRLLSEGWMAFSTGDFDIAADRFQTTLGQAHLADEQKHSALLGLATTYHLDPQPDLDKAQATFEELGRLNTDAARRDSLLGLGMVGLSQAAGESLTDEERVAIIAEARRNLAELLGSFPDSREAAEAAIHLAHSHTQPYPKADKGVFVVPTDATEQAGRRALADWLAAQPENELASTHHMLLGQMLVAERNYEEGVKELIRAHESGLISLQTRAAVVLHIATLAHKKLGDYDMAEKYYELFVREFPRSFYHYQAKERLDQVRAAKESTEG